MSSDMDTDSVFSSCSKDITPVDNFDESSEFINENKKNLNINPIDKNISMGKPQKKKTSIQNLLDDAYKYSSHSDYTLPESFLRVRQKPKSFDIEEDIESPKVRKVKRLVKESKKVTKTKSQGTKYSKKVKEEKGKVGREKKVIDKTIIQPSAGKRGRKKRILEVDLVEKPPKSKRGRKKGSVNKPKTPLIGPVNDSKKTKKGKSSKKEKSAFVDFDLKPFPLEYDFFDIESLNCNTSYDEEPINSTFLTEKYYKTTEISNTTVDSINVKVVKVKYPLFITYAEEFHVDFTNKHFNSVYNPMGEIGKLIEYFVKIYIPESNFAKMEKDVIEPMNKAFDSSDLISFVAAIENYNDLIEKIPRTEMISKLENTKYIPNKFIHDFLHIVYTRSIHPKARTLKKYAAFSSYVYGELLPSFLSEVYKECQLGPDKSFMDLGSGVGNCVVQAALEYGCKSSFGCEIMENASELTEAQYAELMKRCKLFGIKLSPIEFSLRRSFIDNDEVKRLIKECDVLLINNFLFDAKINHSVTKMIQDCKPGCKLISLKSLRPVTYTIDFNDTENILNRLKVQKFKLNENSVSWTHRGGEYYISEVMTDVDETLFASDAGHRRNSKVVKYTR